MQFEVIYITYGLNWSIGVSSKKNIGFQGEGSVILQEIALVFQGNIPKFKLGFLLDIFTFVYEKALYVKSTRTVPYSAIIKYTNLAGVHHINYRLPNGKHCIVKFAMDKMRDDEEFTSKLEEYINSTKSFI